MENFDWGSFILQGVVCWFFYKLGQASIIRAISKDLLKSLEEKGIAVSRNADGNIEFNKNTVETVLEIERVGTQYLAYSDQGKFIGQGPGFRELFESLKSRYPDENFRINKQQKNLTDTEVGEMVGVIFEVFGDKAEKHARSENR